MKNINWKNIFVTAGIALVVVVFIAPKVTPLLKKLPIIGKLIS